MTFTVPDVPDNVYTLLINAADAIDTTNGKLNTAVTNLNKVQTDTGKAVNEALDDSSGLATDALSDIWTDSQNDFGEAQTILVAFTSKGYMGGGPNSPNPLRAVVEANKTAIQNGVLAMERRSAFRRKATPEELDLEDQVEGVMQSTYVERSLGGPRQLDLLPVMTPAIEQFIVSFPGIDRTLLAQIVQWTMEIQDMEDALSNVGLAVEVMLIALNSLNRSGFSGTCATGFVPGQPPPLFPTRAFFMEKNGGDDPYQSFANTFKDNSGSYTSDQVDEIVMWGEEQGLSVDQIQSLLTSGYDAQSLIRLLQEGKINGSNANDVISLLNRGVPDKTITQWLDAGLDPKYANILLDRGVSVSTIDAKANTKGYLNPSTGGQKWKDALNNQRAAINAALQRWASGSSLGPGVSAGHDGMPFRNEPMRGSDGIVQPPFPDPVGTVTAYYVYSATGGDTGARILVDQSGTAYYYPNHYDPATRVKIPYSYMISILGK